MLAVVSRGLVDWVAVAPEVVGGLGAGTVGFLSAVGAPLTLSDDWAILLVRLRISELSCWKLVRGTMRCGRLGATPPG